MIAGAAFASSADRHFEKGSREYAQRSYDVALIHLKNALQEDPKLLPARLLLAEVYFNAGDVDSAQKESEEALKLGADINRVLPIYGQSLLVQEKADELFQLEKYSNSFNRDSQFEWAMLKGQGYLLRNEPDLAREQFEIAATILPQSVRAINTIAAIYMSRDQDQEARKYVDKSLALDPENAKTWHLSGELAFKAKNYDQALEYFQHGHQLNPEDIRLQRSLAQTYLQLGDRAKADKFLHLILETSPGDPAATLFSALLLIGDGDVELGDHMLGDLSSMLAQFDEGRRQTDKTMQFIRASAEYIQGNHANAIELFNIYLLRNQDDIAAVRLLADLYLRNGEERHAAELLSLHFTEVSADPGLSIQLLNLSVKTGNTYRAEELLTALKKNGLSNNPYVVLAEAEVLRIKGRPAAALQLLEARQFGDKEPQGYALLRGVLQLDLGKNAEAQRSAEQLIALYPDAVRINNFAAATYMALDKLEEADTYIDKALRLERENVGAWFNRAMLYTKRGDLDAARRVLRGLLIGQPNYTKAMLLMARIEFQQRMYAEAIAWSDRVYSYDTESRIARQLQIEIYAEAGLWQKARVAAQRLVRVDPSNTDYLVQLAELAMKAGDQPFAQSTLIRLYPLWEHDPEKLRRLAEMQARFNNPVAARKTLRKALKLHKDAYAIQLDIARLDLAQGKYDSAQNSAKALVKAFGERSATSQLLGEIAVARQQPDVARQHYMKAFKLDNDNAEAVIGLYELSSKGAGSRAFTAMMESTLKKDALPVVAVRLMADSYLNQGETAKAALYYEKLLDLEHLASDPEILNNLANIYAEYDLDKALATALVGLKASNEQSYALLDTVGWILARQGENEQALSYLRKSYTINSADPEIRYHLGATLLALDRVAEAEAELRAAVDSGKHFIGRDNAAQLLASIP
jgi:putative PEP-CTERM system TPR-repeat lipoprotein